MMPLDYTAHTHESLHSHASTTVQTVLDKDVKLKNALHNKWKRTALTHADNKQLGLESLDESGTGSKGKARFLLTEDTSTGLHRVYSSVSFIAGQYHGVKIDAEANGRDLVITLPSTAFGAAVSWAFDLTAGTATQITGGTKDAGIISLNASGEYECTVFAEATATVTDDVRFGAYNATASYTGDGSSGVYLSRPRVMKASVHAPVERVINGVFATDTDWTKGTGVTIGSGVASLSSATGGAHALRQDKAHEAGTYRVEFTVSNYSAGEISPNFIGVSGTGTGVSANGTYVELMTLSASDSAIGFSIYADSTATLDIDNVSVTKVITDGVQLTQGTTAGGGGEDFMETNGAAVYSDGASLRPDGRMRLQCFEGRTNVVANSNDFTTGSGNAATVEANSSVGLDGDLSASHIVEDGTTAIHRFQAASQTINGAHVIALRAAKTSSRRLLINADNLMNAKALFDLTDGSGSVVATSGSAVDLDAKIYDEGNFYLCVLIGTGTNTSQTHYYQLCESGHTTTADDSYAGDGSSYIALYGMDIQAGSSVGPYIPTSGASASRSATGAYKALGDLIGFRQDQYTVIVEFESAGSDGADFPRVFEINDETGDNRSDLWISSGNNMNQDVRVDGTTQVGNLLGSYTPDTVTKAALAFKRNDFAASDDGDAVVTDSVGSMPAVSTLYAGRDANANQLNGYLGFLSLTPIRAANDTVVSEAS